MRGHITINGHSQPTQVAFKNCAPFIKSITKIDGTKIDDAEDLDLVMPIYNLLEHSSNYSDMTGIYGFTQKMKQVISIMTIQTIVLLNLSDLRLNN